MNTPSPLLRPLQALAAVLAVAIAALLVAWTQVEPAPASAAVDPGLATSAREPAAAVAGAAVRAPVAGEDAVANRSASAPAADDPSTTARAVLFGSVKRADGTLLSEDGVCWLYRDGKHLGTEHLRDGTFGFAGLRAGPHRLTSRIPDELPLDREVIVTAPTTRLDLVLPARWLLHVDAVTPDGAPLIEALSKQPASRFFSRSLRALAFDAPLARDLPGSRSSEFEAGLGASRSNDPFGMRGQKALPKQTIAVLALPADRPVHVALLLGGAVLAQQEATPGQQAVTFTLDLEAVLAKTCVVRLRCVDPTGAPVAGARPWLSSGSSGSQGQATDGQGRHVASKLVPGVVTFSIHHKGLCMPTLQVDLAPGADVDLGDITLRPAAEVELSFADFGGEGSLQLFWLDAPAGARWSGGSSHHSQQNGVSQKASLFPGRYLAFARGKRGVALVELDTAALPPGPLRFDLRPGAPLRIDNRIGTGFARFQLATARGAVFYRGELGSRGGFTHLVPPGEYVATVDTGTGTPTRKPFTLPASGATLALP